MIDRLFSEKVPPQNLEAEQSFLGSMLLKGVDISKKARVIKPNDFYREAHSRIFSAMQELMEAGTPVDVITVSDVLRRKNIIDAVGGSVYLCTLFDSVPTPANIDYYANIVLENSWRRECMTGAQRLFEVAQEGNDWPETKRVFQELALTLPDAEEELNRESQREELLTMLMDALARTQTEECIGLSTGFPTFDDKSEGLLPKLLYVIAARPSIGKTSFALSMMRHIARNKRVYFFSLEQTRRQILWRLVSIVSGFSSRIYRQEVLTPFYRDALSKAVDTVQNLNLIIDDDPGLTVGEMNRRVKLAHAEKPIDAVFIDHLGEIDVPGDLAPYVATNRALKGSKKIAKEFEVPVVLLCQLSRANEKREDKRPILSDLRESGKIEEVADMVAGLYRSAYYSPEIELPDEDQEAELNILKHRDGPTGRILLSFRPSTTFFSDGRNFNGY